MRHKPDKSEYPLYFSRYIDLVQDETILQILEQQQLDMDVLLDSIDEKTAACRYAPGKWSVKEVLGHVIDVERVFSYRALCFARNDTTALPSFDENAYITAANFDARPLQDIQVEFQLVRQATRSLFSGFDPDYMMRQGTASGHKFSVRALAYIIAGHDRHHRQMIKEKYLSI